MKPVFDYKIHRKTIRSRDELDSFVEKGVSHGEMGFDLETVSPVSIKENYSLHCRNAEILGFSLGIVYHDTKEVYTAYIPINHRVITDVEFRFVPPPAKIGAYVEDCCVFHKERVPFQLEFEDYMEVVERILTDPSLTVYCHNCNYDIGRYLLDAKNVAANFLKGGPDAPKRTYSQNVVCKVKDSLLSGYLLHKKILGLKLRTRYDAGYEMKTLNAIKDGKGYDRLDEVSIEDMAEYAQDDSWTSPLIGHIHEKEFLGKALHKDKQFVFDTIENPCAVVLTHMETTGMYLDCDGLAAVDEELKAEKAEIENTCLSLLGRDINLRSGQQVSNLLYDEFKWWKPHYGDESRSAWERDKNGFYPTSKEFIKDLLYYENQRTEEGLVFAEAYQKYNSVCTLISSFTDKLHNFVVSESRIHCRYNQAFTSTNRLSSSEPNLQNIPSRTAYGKKIRACFRARPGWSVVAADYSQMEMRILAHMTQDIHLLDVFHNELDIHDKTSELLGVTRDFAKTINYGTIYGIGSEKLGRDLKIKKSEAQQHLQNFYNKYERLGWYVETITKVVRARGYTRSLFGNTRTYFEDIRTGEYWQNKAQNHPIQSTSADIVKLAMSAIYRWLVEENMLYDSVLMVAQVHDEIVFEVRDDVLEYFKKKCYEIMMGVVDLSVPMVVDVNSGESWSEAH